ncbi:unnamed protein product [Linum tenue]|uniref:WAT1-related protein n=1 Tax=Linum tenue TaxID=586396 RepID=A0AAV0NBB2_9ROSI|nr:unnamed protein product [Linum tenue]
MVKTEDIVELWTAWTLPLWREATYLPRSLCASFMLMLGPKIVPISASKGRSEQDQKREMAGGGRLVYGEVMAFSAMIKSSSSAKFLGTLESRSSGGLWKFIPDHGIRRHQLQLSYACFSYRQPHSSFHLLTCCHLQTQIMKEYPAEVTVVFFYNIVVCIIAAFVALVTEGTSPTAWILKPNVALASVICSGFGSCLNNSVHTWALRIKGPVFVAMFKPLSIAIAVAMGVMFLGDTLYLGSVIGAVVISIGFYTVMWGKAQEDDFTEACVTASCCNQQQETHYAEKAPLLQSYRRNAQV